MFMCCLMAFMNTPDRKWSRLRHSFFENFLLSAIAMEKEMQDLPHVVQKFIIDYSQVSTQIFVLPTADSGRRLPLVKGQKKYDTEDEGSKKNVFTYRKWAKRKKELSYSSFKKRKKLWSFRIQVFILNLLIFAVLVQCTEGSMSKM